MHMKQQHTEDVAKIMGVDDDMVHLLPQIDAELGILNPWVRQLPGILRGLKLHAGQTVLDIPCGTGKVSVPLAHQYGTTVLGYDILEGYVAVANTLALKRGVDRLCTFQVADVRDVTKRQNICDVLLWIAPPHLWASSKETMRALRRCVRPGGKVVIGDGYLYAPTARYEDHETLAAMNAGYRAFGDDIVRFIDYKSTLWRDDFNRARKVAQRTLQKITSKKDRDTLQRYLDSLDQEEQSDTKHMGLGIWIVKINK